MDDGRARVDRVLAEVAVDGDVIGAGAKLLGVYVGLARQCSTFLDARANVASEWDFNAVPSPVLVDLLVRHCREQLGRERSDLWTFTALVGALAVVCFDGRMEQDLFLRLFDRLWWAADGIPLARGGGA
jgi:hypothetical protein